MTNCNRKLNGTHLVSVVNVELLAAREELVCRLQVPSCYSVEQLGLKLIRYSRDQFGHYDSTEFLPQGHTASVRGCVEEHRRNIVVRHAFG